MKYSYSKETPWWLIITIVIFLRLAIAPLANLMIIGSENLDFGHSKNLKMEALGQLGDFFGGHTAAFTGSLSLVLVLFLLFINPISNINSL